MKKLLAILLVLALMPVVGLAELDLSSMSDGDLLTLKDSIENELAARSLTPDDLMTKGVYVVGVDIRPDRYKFHLAGTVEDWDRYGFTLYDENGEYIDNVLFTDPTETYTMTINEGWSIEVWHYSSVWVEPFAPSYAP